MEGIPDSKWPRGSGSWCDLEEVGIQNNMESADRRAGYGVTCASNIEGPIHNDFSSMNLLPLISLIYAAATAACIPLACQLVKICNLKALYLVSLVVIAVGCILAGNAANIDCILGGCAIMAAGGSVLYQCAMCFNTIYAQPDELVFTQAWLGAVFAIGLAGGPLIGGAIADSPHTWRWTKKSALTRFGELDWLGNWLHVCTFVLFTIACVSSGPSREWNSRSAVGAWMAFAVVFLTYTGQQALNLGIANEGRIFPWSLLRSRTVFLTWVCTFCVAGACSLVLYYTPIYFVLMRVHSRLDATSRLIPFICAFVVSTVLAGGLIGYIRAYRLAFMVGAALLAVGSGLLHGITPDTTDRAIRAYEAFIGAGIGTIWHLATPVCALILPAERRLDQAALQSIAQFGGIVAARSAAAVIYHDIGGRLLKEAVADAAYSDEDIRELLSGIRSRILTETNPDTVVLVFEIIVEATARCFSLLVIAGVVCFVAACCMKAEELDFRDAKKKSAPPAPV
ncbi:hypothetical protein DL766_008391 [Monosporascus sp. MC13-8B]|uniref:Major facilitator superfamily (MFS) profile domain-containing protein n=1 Tax=Monosporascus cannonballus TaxID=155416 RepID=A0ABY0HF06_9PEZI|nr:hypothetical protein DL763_010346 [Monosporascus cannonballus]RYO89008.1 hypothetical protein DL762_003438 [Monosporascus cannonballus]RYP19613.1 hypothetical protein DL766_008391 [Monosporascus sp. MC13-8B]